MSTTHNVSKALPLVAYGSVAAPMAILIVPLYNYLPTFYASDLAVNLSAIGVIFFVSRLWDSLLDPLIGMLSDHTRSRWGRRKPWIVAASPGLVVLSYAICVPPASAGNTYVTLVLFLFYVAWSCVQIPHLAWGAELAHDYVERSRVVMFREVLFMLGILSAVVLPAFLFGREALNLRRVMYLYAMMIVVLIPATTLFAMTLTPDSAVGGITKTSLSDVIQILRSRSAFVRLIVAYSLMQLGSTIWDSLVIFLMTRVLHLDHEFLWIISIQVLVTIAAMPAVFRAGRTIDKHRLLALFAIGFPLGGLILATAPAGNIGIAVLGVAILAISVAPWRVMPTSMAADCADLDRLQSGVDRTGTHMAVITFFFKLALAAGVGIAFPLLDAIGFDSRGANSPAVLSHLRMIVSILPGLVMLPALFMLWNYPLTRSVHSNIRRQLDAGPRSA